MCVFFSLKSVVFSFTNNQHLHLREEREGVDHIVPLRCHRVLHTGASNKRGIISDLIGVKNIALSNKGRMLTPLFILMADKISVKTKPFYFLHFHWF